MLDGLGAQKLVDLVKHLDEASTIYLMQIDAIMSNNTKEITILIL